MGKKERHPILSRQSFSEKENLHDSGKIEETIESTKHVPQLMAEEVTKYNF